MSSCWRTNPNNFQKAGATHFIIVDAQNKLRTLCGLPAQTLTKSVHLGDMSEGKTHCICSTCFERFYEYHIPGIDEGVSENNGDDERETD